MSTRPGTATALLVIDVQEAVVADAWDRDRIVGNVALAVERARAAGVPVFWIQHEDDELVNGSAGWQWVEELRPREGEPRVHKRFNSAFEDTPLLAALDAAGVSRVVIAGAATNWCIRASAYGALERGFDLTLVSDAHTTGDMEPTPGQVVSARTVIDDLNAAMRWLSYPGRRNEAVPAADLAF